MKAGDAVQFFAIDNIDLRDAELLWLDQELSRSQARWKLVYGHYHIYSATRGDNPELIERLLPMPERQSSVIHVQFLALQSVEPLPRGSNRRSFRRLSSRCAIPLLEGDVVVGPGREVGVRGRARGHELGLVTLLAAGHETTATALSWTFALLLDAPAVRARLVALTWISDEWAAFVRSVRVPDDVHPADAYLVLQTLVGAWPLTCERLGGYLEKALREGKLRSNWLDPDVAYERRVQELAWSLRDVVEPFVARVAPLGEQIALAQTLLKLTCPGVPDIYQGDELESLNLVDPDNRRSVDWDARRRALVDPPAKLSLIRETLALRARRPDAFSSSYEPVDMGPAACTFVRGGQVLVMVPLRPGEALDAPAGWRPLREGMLYERS